MKYVAMYISGDMDFDFVDKTMDRFITAFKYRDISAVRLNDNNLVTTKVHVEFINSLEGFEGKIFDEIFGTVPYRILHKHLKDYRQHEFTRSLLRYILDEERSDKDTIKQESEQIRDLVTDIVISIFEDLISIDEIARTTDEGIRKYEIQNRVVNSYKWRELCDLLKIEYLD